LIRHWLEREGEVAARNLAQDLPSATLLSLSKRIGQGDTVADEERSTREREWFWKGQSNGLVMMQDDLEG
jgi:hypothetical protein